jgi:anti-sigma B factor antagonist
MAQFEARTSAETHRVVVALTGECDLAVRDKLTAALHAAVTSSPMVVVDVGGLTFLDSSGVHGLVTAYHAARDLGGELFVTNANGTVATVLDITGIGDLLRPAADDERLRG